MTSAHLTAIDRSYLLHEQLGRGGMGAVFRATERTTRTEVALKLVSLTRLLPDDEGREAVYTRRLALAWEFQTLASLHHPHIVAVRSYGFDPDYGPYFTMELLDAPQTLVEAGAGKGVATKVQLLAQLLRALAYLHRRGLLHRDLKPSTVEAGFTRR